MKRPFVFITAIVMAGCAAPPAGELQPADFAYGQSFTAPAGEAFVRVALPDVAYTQTAWPDLRDVRTFNAAGEPVPFARMRPAPTAAAARRIALRSFKLERIQPGTAPRVELDAGTGSVQMRVIPGAAPDSGAEYMLAAADNDAQARVGRLILNWADTTQNWQQNVTVSVSQDLQSWTTVAFKRPIMDLRTPEGERLTHREVTIDASISGGTQYWQAITGFAGHYWRLQFEPGFSPALTGVEGDLIPDIVPAPGVTLETLTEPQPDGSLVFRLNGVHPIARLQISPGDANSVLPIQIQGRRDDKDPWQFVASTVVYRLNVLGGEQISEPVRLDGASYSSFRVKPFGTAWGTKSPTLLAERDALVLIVNARGSGPFLLAWGSRAAADSSVDAALLVPGGSTQIAGTRDAAMGATQQLGGTERLTAVSPAERAARWQTILVWVALVGGAVSLAFLALRLLRETRTTT